MRLRNVSLRLRNVSVGGGARGALADAPLPVRAGRDTAGPRTRPAGCDRFADRFADRDRCALAASLPPHAPLSAMLCVYRVSLTGRGSSPCTARTRTQGGVHHREGACWMAHPGLAPGPALARLPAQPAPTQSRNVSLELRNVRLELRNVLGARLAVRHVDTVRVLTERSA